MDSYGGRLVLQQPGYKLEFSARHKRHFQGLEKQAPQRDMVERFLARSPGTMKMGLYARVSTHDQQTLALQRNALVAYAPQRRGTIVAGVEEIGSGVNERLQRERLMRAARRREIDVIVVWRLDRWGRSLADLVSTLQELHELGSGFISLSEALDFTTPTGRAMAGMLAVFAEFERGILRERVKAGIAEARRRGTRHGRPPTVAHQADAVRQLYAEGLSKSAIHHRTLFCC